MNTIGGIRIAREVSITVITIALVGILLAIAIYFISANFSNQVKLVIGDGTLDTRLALDEPSRVQGLSGVDNLPKDQALLMAFPSDGLWQIWMKDMKIPIDIVWLSNDKKIIYIVKNADPELGTTRTYVPKDKARYVVELPAGQVDALNIRVNTTALFDLQDKKVE
jgi:uncharacterized membrane protein (UPF0127 family)